MVSLDSLNRKSLINKETIHSLISLSLPALESATEQKAEEEKSYIRESVRVLHNLAAFDRPKFYIPGETVNVSQGREKFSACGGLVGLYYLGKYAVLPEVKKFFESNNNMELNDLTNIVDYAKSRIAPKPTGSASENEPSLPE